MGVKVPFMKQSEFENIKRYFKQRIIMFNLIPLCSLIDGI